ncbi:hypothetical protein BD769DRAFT_1473339, partial [Suillus cothurnatus]
MLQQALLDYNRDYPQVTYHHTHHCLNYLRQTLMCDLAHMLEIGYFLSVDYEKDRMGDTLACRDWARQILYLKSTTRSGCSGKCIGT